MGFWVGQARFLQCLQMQRRLRLLSQRLHSLNNGMTGEGAFESRQEDSPIPDRLGNPRPRHARRICAAANVSPFELLRTCRATRGPEAAANRGVAMA